MKPDKPRSGEIKQHRVKPYETDKPQSGEIKQHRVKPYETG